MKKLLLLCALLAGCFRQGPTLSIGNDDRPDSSIIAVRDASPGIDASEIDAALPDAIADLDGEIADVENADVENADADGADAENADIENTDAAPADAGFRDATAPRDAGPPDAAPLPDGAVLGVDLTIAFLPAPAPTIRQGHALTADVQASNLGDTASSSVTVGYFLCTPPCAASSIFLAQLRAPALQPLSAAILSPTFSIPASLPSGDYALFAIIDYFSEVAEVREGNNISPLFRIAVADIEVAPSPLDFGAVVVGTTVQLPLLVTNHEASLTIHRIAVTPASAFEFAAIAQTPIMLTQGASFVIDVRFSPANLGPRAGRLEIFHDRATIPLTVEVYGDGI